MDTASNVAGHLLDVIAGLWTVDKFATISVPIATIQALGFATGALLCVLVGTMQWQSDRDARQRVAYALLWSLGGVWSIGSFTVRLLGLGGFGEASSPSASAAVVAWSSTCFAPSVILYLIHCEFPARTLGRRLLLATSWYLAAALFVLLLFAAFRPGFPLTVATVAILSFFSSIAHMLASGAIYLRRRVRESSLDRAPKPPNRMLRVTIVLMALSATATAISIYGPRDWVALRIAGMVIGQQWMLVWTIVVAVYLAETRHADVVLKRCLTIVSSVAIGAAVASVMPGLGRGVPVVVGSLAIAGLIMSAPLVKRGIFRIVDQVILDRPDYAALARAFADRARRAASEQELFTLAIDDIHRALRVNAHIVVTSEGIGRIDVLRRLTIGASPTREILIEPTTEGRTLMREENVYLETVAGDVSRRLESLAFEHERRERQMREERLTHSLTQAELKALRAQVDPHFLFNTLNAIADLIATDPDKAEAMTERLADFFRYTLARTDRTLTTLDQELEFVRQYLDIERIRFGERLGVEVSSEPGLGGHTVPALILQPLIENAVRHGLAPKREGGRIVVSATCDGGFLHLRVADDGVGMNGEPSSSGIGLANVRERLHTLYRDNARLTIEPVRGAGTSVSVVLPALSS